MSEALRILFHTRGGHVIGLGHVMRCLALADALHRRVPAARIVFEGGAEPEAVRLIEAGGYPIVPDQIADLVIVDVPQAEGELFRRWRESGAVTVSVDDPGPGRYAADLAIAMLYEPRTTRPEGSPTRDLRGLPWVMLKSAFRNLPLKEIPDRIGRVLICQGGSDTHGLTPQICAALKAWEGAIGMDVVLGPDFLHNAELQEALGGDSRFKVHRGPNSLLPLMVAADLCVSAAGMTSLELAAAGVPMILVVAEPKEAETAARLQEEGVAVYAGGPKSLADGTLLRELCALDSDRGRREALSRRAQSKIDGRGTERVVEAVLEAAQRRT